MKKGSWRFLLPIAAIGYFCSSCFCQDVITEEQLAVALPKPTGLHVTNFPFGSYTPTSATVAWDASQVSFKYDIQVWRVVDGRKEIETWNHPMTLIRLQNLTPGTEYRIIVRAVAHAKIKSPFSEPFFFKTPDPCNSGQEFSECYGHCHATCKDKNPTCARSCVPGCSCPLGMFQADGVCILEKNCGKELNKIKVTGEFRKPKNLKMLPLRGPGNLKVLLTWDVVSGADSYTVTVVIEATGKIHEKAIGVKVPYYVVENLKKGVGYSMIVTAVWTEAFGSSGRDFTFNLIRIPAPTLLNATDNSIKISWSANDLKNIDSFGVLLYDSDTNLIMSFPGLDLNYYTVEGLESGTDYKLAVNVVMDNDNVTSVLKSDILDVKTSGDFDMTRKYPTGAFVEAVLTEEETTTTTTAEPITTAVVPTSTCSEIYNATRDFMNSNPEAASGTTLPSCDDSGNYVTRQCTRNACVCVDSITGSVVRFSDFDQSINIDCDHYGLLVESPVDLTVTVIDSTSIYVRWIASQKARQHIVKVLNGVTNEMVQSVFVPSKKVATITNLMPGHRYRVLVVAISEDGQTSSDKANGRDVFTPYLNPPSRVRIYEFAPTNITIKWNDDPSASHYYIELIAMDSKKVILTLDNVQDSTITFNNLVEDESYEIVIQSRSVRSDPTTGEDVVVRSNPTSTKSYERCHPPIVDMIIGVDVSKKIRNVNFQKVKRMFGKIIGEVEELSESTSRVATFKFSEDAQEVFPFGKFFDRSSLTAEINGIPQSQDTILSLGKMIRFIQSNYFGAESKLRPTINTVVVIFIGESSDDEVSAQDIQLLKQSAAVIGIGIKGKADMRLMAELGNGNAILMNSFSQLEEAVRKTRKIMCSLKTA